MIDMFSKFIKTEYDIDGIIREVTNIAVGEITIRNKVDSSYVLWKYDLFDGDTPVSVSDTVYGSTAYYWTILYINNIINPYTDWYMSQSELEKYAARKYTGVNATHHYEYRSPTETRVLDDVDSLPYVSIPSSSLPAYVFRISNIDYERSLNFSKKSITIINPKFISQFAEEFHNAVSSKLAA